MIQSSNSSFLHDRLKNPAESISISFILILFSEVNVVNYVYFTLSDRSTIDNILREMCKGIISLLCNHVVVYVIHQISFYASLMMTGIAYTSTDRNFIYHLVKN